MLGGDARHAARRRSSPSRSLRGSTVGAVAGFFAGLVVDIALLDTLGMTSLLLTLVGYWTGRYGETTARDRRYAPYLAVCVMTFLFLARRRSSLRFMLARAGAGAATCSSDSLVQSVALNLLLMWPVFALVRRLLPRRRAAGTFGRGGERSLASTTPQRPLAALPPARPEGRGAVSPDAEDGDARRHPRRLRARRLRRPLPPALVAADPLHRRSTARRRCRTSCGRCRSRRPAARSSTGQGRVLVRNVASNGGRRSGRPSLPRRTRAATRRCGQLAKLLEMPVPGAPRDDPRRTRTTR